MKIAFADTFSFLALSNPRDSAHKTALHASTTLKVLLVTTDCVLTETADTLCDHRDRNGCIGLIDDLRSWPHVEIEPATRARFDAGWELFRRHHDKDRSLADCISFVVMKKRGITDALTSDHHFEQAGFRALLK